MEQCQAQAEPAWGQGVLFCPLTPWPFAQPTPLKQHSQLGGSDLLLALAGLGAGMCQVNVTSLPARGHACVSPVTYLAVQTGAGRPQVMHTWCMTAEKTRRGLFLRLPSILSQLFLQSQPQSRLAMQGQLVLVALLSHS